MKHTQLFHVMQSPLLFNFRMFNCQHSFSSVSVFKSLRAILLRGIPFSILLNFSVNLCDFSYFWASSIKIAFNNSILIFSCVVQPF